MKIADLSQIAFKHHLAIFYDEFGVQIKNGNKKTEMSFEYIEHVSTDDMMTNLRNIKFIK